MRPVLVHISDLHCGWPYIPETIEALLAAIAELRPAAVVVSGDWVQRGDFLDWWRQARAFADRLPKPWIGVPGNHDLPLWNPLRRAFAPYERYREYICPELDPLLEVEGATIAGINSARPWSIDLGHVSAAQLERVRRAFAAAPPGALRAVTLHHPLLPQREAGLQRHHVYGYRRAVRVLAEAGAEIVLSGHNHFPKHVTLSERFPDSRGLVLAQCGTLSRRLRPRTGHNLNDFNVICWTAAEINVESWHLRDGRFAPAATYRYPRVGCHTSVPSEAPPAGEPQP